MKDWIGVLTQLRVPYRDTGAHTTSGHINIKCPWCGTDDRGEHLGINLQTGAYHCWRNPAHAGYSAYRLLTALGSLSSVDIGKIIVKYGLKTSSPLNAPIPLLPEKSVPDESLEARWGRFPSHDPLGIMIGYLRNRGFDFPSLIASVYGLKWGGITGYWKYRVLFPVGYGTLAGWTGRTIGDAEPKYLTTSKKVDGAIPERFIYVPGGSSERRSEVFVICEGPLDALKITEAGRPLGIQGVALVGKDASSKEEALWEVIHNGSVAVMLDSDTTESERDELCRRMGKITKHGSRIWSLPEGAKDAGECKIAVLREHLECLLNGEARFNSGRRGSR